MRDCTAHKEEEEKGGCGKQNHICVNEMAMALVREAIDAHQSSMHVIPIMMTSLPLSLSLSLSHTHTHARARTLIYRYFTFSKERERQMHLKMRTYRFGEIIEINAIEGEEIMARESLDGCHCQQ